jgi:single-strand DNA-binding protein
MFHMNQVKVAGQVTREPEVRQTAGGKTMGRFALAVQHSWRGKDGGDQQSTLFIPIVVWDDLAASCGTIVQKSANILVEGRLQIRPYQGHDGQRRLYTQIVGTKVALVEEEVGADGTPKTDTHPGNPDLIF